MSRTFRAAAVFVALLAVLLALLVVVGRWEERRHARSENRGIARIRALVGPLDRADAYRIEPGLFNCLLFRRGGNRYALELCFDRQGRVVEAIDRRRYPPTIASLREDHGAAKTRVDPAQVTAILTRLGAF